MTKVTNVIDSGLSESLWSSRIHRLLLLITDGNLICLWEKINSISVSTILTQLSTKMCSLFLKSAYSDSKKKKSVIRHERVCVHPPSSSLDPRQEQTSVGKARSQDEAPSRSRWTSCLPGSCGEWWHFIFKLSFKNWLGSETMCYIELRTILIIEKDHNT